MADRGHELTDKLLSDLEDLIAQEYADALRDMEKKLKDLLDKYERDDAIQKKLLAEGKITKEEYKSWAFRHKMMNKRWEQMRDALAEDMHHANEIALRIAQNQMPDVYALNANYALYEIEKGGKIYTGLTLYNRDTAAYLFSGQRQLMPGPSDAKQKKIAENKDMQWNQKKIQSAVFQGVIQGETPFQVAARLMSVAKMNYNAAVRYARTMTTNAQNSGRYNSYRRARDLGVELTIEWRATLDMHTRHDHRMMHGQRHEVDEPFITPDGFSILYPAQSDGPGSSDIPQKEIWNCRCTLRAWVKGFEGETVKSSPGMEGLSFEEWQNMADDDPRRKPIINAASDREQFDRYKKVLGSAAPKTITDFQKLKYNSPDEWEKLKAKYRVVNRYEVDGKVSAKEIHELDYAAFTTKRTGFDYEPLHGHDRDVVKDMRTGGNAAVMKFNGKIYFSHSAVDYPGTLEYDSYKGPYDLIGLKRNRRFEVLDLGDGIPRKNDTEAKFFEYLADVLEPDSTVKITILSEKHICKSCQHVRDQFQKMFPGVTINIVSGKENFNGSKEGLKTWRFRKKKL